MTYIDEARRVLDEELTREGIPGVSGALLDLYALLVLVRGTEVTEKDVHDAWAVWASRALRDRRQLIPYEELDQDVQKMSEPFAEAISSAAYRLRFEG